VWQVGVAEEVGAFALRALAKTRWPSVDSVTPGPKKSDACPMVMRTSPASRAANNSSDIAARTRPFTVVAASVRSSIIGVPPVGS